MSNWRNLIPRRKYRERAQPQKRSHLGILEKKKDYQKRAEDFHKKEDVLAKMKEKQLNQNPDQFKFNMVGANKKSEKGDSTDLRLVDMQR